MNIEKILQGDDSGFNKKNWLYDREKDANLNTQIKEHFLEMKVKAHYLKFYYYWQKPYTYFVKDNYVIFVTHHDEWDKESKGTSFARIYPEKWDWWKENRAHTIYETYDVTITEEMLEKVRIM